MVATIWGFAARLRALRELDAPLNQSTESSGDQTPQVGIEWGLPELSAVTIQ
jgi:hypothetical protein